MTAARSRPAPHYDISAHYVALRETCDLAGLDRLGLGWWRNVAFDPDILPGLLRYLLPDAVDLESSRALLALHRAWGDAATAEAAANPLPVLQPRPRCNRLRVGLLSSRLGRHPVGRFVLPLLRHYDRKRFEFIAFAPAESPGDPVQAEIREHVSRFEVFGLAPPREIAARIRELQIDVLLELDGHTEGNSLAALAYRAAPVQIEWLGYQFTTGLPAADYFLMDDRLAPAATDLMCETPLVVAGSWVCFAPDDGPEIQPEPPAAANGYVTFGTLAHPFKFTRAAISAWAGALKAVPDSRFLVVRPEAANAAFRSHVAAAFAREGIWPERVEFFDNAAAGVPHFDCYNRLDVALDTWPAAGGTTTCDALWMGVPVVSCSGPAPHQRLGLSLLSGIGLEGCCVPRLAGFAAAAAAMASDVAGLSALRRSLRDRLRAAPLGDADVFTANFQAAIGEAAGRLP